MPNFRELLVKVLADGKVDGHEVEMLSDLIYADAVVDRTEADFLVELKRRVTRPSPGFEKFFYKAVAAHVLHGGVLTPEKADWLRAVIFADGKVHDLERKLVREVRGQARRTCPEFEALYADCEAAKA